MTTKTQSQPPVSRTKSLTLYKRCLGYFRPYWLHITLATMAMLFVAMTQPAIAYLVKPTLDEIFDKKDATYLVAIALAYPCLELAKVSFRTIQNYVMQYCGLRVLERLRDELFQKMIYLPMRYYESAQVGMLMSRVINDVVLIRASMPALIMLVRQVFTVIFLICVAFYQDAFLAFWAIIVMPVAFFPFIYFGRRMRKLSRKGQAKLADISVLLQEIFSGIRVVKAFSTEEREAKRFDKENRRLLSLLLKQTLASELSSSTMELMGALAGALIVYYGGMQVIDGHSTPGTFFSFLTATIMLYDPVKKMANSNNEIQKALAGAERVFEILDSPDISIEKDGTVPFDGEFESLDFENVSFCYQDGTRALDNVSLSIRRGERVALVGPSGGGKTTFVNMIPRFYEPTEGRISLNGRPLADYTLASLRRSIAMVSQDSFLFNISVTENILYGQEQLGEEYMRDAAKAAYADGFITSLLDGYETLVGERGTKLSGGQKQRITIARAIAKNAPLLILDEATSALDSESEGIVQAALENLMQNRTSIVIAHRLATILNADRILVVEGGHIVAEGSHAELLQRSPLYAKLYEMQFSHGQGGEE
ncbi:ABC transporter ATP-binding protein/permease [Desulfovibrio sp. OttesenSCG-928-O18]|nr:ABC transporter ATP-binding protein/permease [Desulfovibrio sp. OttesenSCG-928-O18]